MENIRDLDSAIKHATEAVSNNAREVSRALSAFVAAPSSETAVALRIALVAQAAGHEACAADGSTFAARKAAAAAAIAAWDGPDGPAKRFSWQVAGHKVSTDDAALVRVLGYETSHHPDGSGSVSPGHYPMTAAIAAALSEGLRSEAALIRAAAIVRAARDAIAPAQAEQQAADKRFHAACVERQAAILHARARGLSDADIERIVR